MSIPLATQVVSTERLAELLSESNRVTRINIAGATVTVSHAPVQRILVQGTGDEHVLLQPVPVDAAKG